MSLVPYKKNGLQTKKKKNRVQVNFNPNQMLYDLGFGAMQGAGELTVRAVKGIVSAFQSRGANRSDIRQVIAPLAKSLSYGSKKPSFTNVTGGIQIEHIENISLTGIDNSIQISSNTFSWLRNIANSFEEYQIKLWFAWNPVCPATSTGVAYMAFDYDPQDLGGYLTPSDFFATADHCVGAIWTPGAISPQKSGWLKTDTTGDSRLYSPGTLHMNVSAMDYGFLTAKYQVSLRKPQPTVASNEAQFDGTYTAADEAFGTVTETHGDTSLYTVNSSSLTVKPTSGYKIVTWSTDATLTSITPTYFGGGPSGRILGTKTGANASIVIVFDPATLLTDLVLTVVPAPGGPTTYRVHIQQSSLKPAYY